MERLPIKCSELHRKRKGLHRSCHGNFQRWRNQCENRQRRSQKSIFVQHSTTTRSWPVSHLNYFNSIQLLRFHRLCAENDISFIFRPIFLAPPMMKAKFLQDRKTSVLFMISHGCLNAVNSFARSWLAKKSNASLITFHPHETTSQRNTATLY